MGGIIGMMIANAMPGLIRSLVLNDVGCFIPAAGLARILAYAGAPTQFATREEAQAALRNNMKSFGITEERHWQHIFTHSIQTQPDGCFCLAYDPAILSALPKTEKVEDINMWSMWEALKVIPILLIRGARSDILLSETAQFMQSQHPQLELQEIANTGHAPALVADDQIATIVNWLEKRR